MKKLITIISFLLVGISTQAQDFVFSQFQLSPLNLNPALTGTNSNDQLIVNYRDQWRNFLGSAAFKTLSVSYDKPLRLKNGDVIGVGAKFINDEGGSSNLTNRGGALLTSYQKRIMKSSGAEQFLIAGIEGGYFNQSVDAFGTTLNSDYFDFGLGLAYRIKFNEQRSFKLGASLAHIFSQNPEPNRRFILHTSYNLKVTDKLIVTPRIAYVTQSGSEILVASVGAKFLIKDFNIEANFGRRSGVFESRAYFFSPAIFYKNQIGFAATLEFNKVPLNGDGIETYEGSIIYRFGKKSTEIPQ